MQKLRVLDLFSGIGGFSLGLEWTGGFETVAFCEIEKYPQEVLAKNFPGVPIYADIKKLTAERLVSDGIGTIDVITGGYPCQPFSVAGKQKGEKDDRHLWPSMLEIIAQVRPSWVICENVTGHIALGLDQVLLDLETEGYASRTFIVPACSVNAPHRRDRLWIVAHAGLPESPGREEPETDYGRCSGEGIQEGSEPSSPCSSVAHTNKLTGGSREVHRKPSDKGRAASTAGGGCIPPKDNEESASNPATCGENVADSESQRIQGHRVRGKQEPHPHEEKTLSLRGSKRSAASHWAVEPGMGRVANGIPGRVAKLKSLGNAVVPQIPMMIGQAILDYEQNEKV